MTAVLTLLQIMHGAIDSDGDGIIDHRDLCPNQPETFNDFQDRDGYPDSYGSGDRDLDGIPDQFDACPQQKKLTINSKTEMVVQILYLDFLD